MDFEVSSELVAIYLEDAREHLAVLDRTLLALERDGHDGETAPPSSARCTRSRATAA